MKNEHKCQCCGEDAEYINPNGYLCYTCAATIASMEASRLLRGENVNPAAYSFTACLEACDIKSIDKEESE